MFVPKLKACGKAQGALEYLLLIGGAIMIAAIVITLSSGIGTGGTGGAQESYSQYQDIYSGLRGQVYGSGVVTLEITQGISYQDEGTASCDDMTLLKTLDSAFAPDPCGTVTNLRYVNGTSGAYFDALAVMFDASSYPAADYDGTLRMYIRDGGYGTAYHHYKVYDAYHDNSCLGSAAACGAASFADGYEGWVEVPLSDDYWDDGDLSVRIWDASVDRIEIVLTPAS